LNACGPPDQWECSICKLYLHPVTLGEEAQQLANATEHNSQFHTTYALQCLDCHTYLVYCWDCMNTQHHLHPFHQTGVACPGDFCARTTLSKQGYIFHLHPGNRPCPDSKSSTLINKFVIVDSGSIHTFSIDKCSCANKDLTYQLIAAGLFPATFSDPRTAFTFDALDYYLLDNTACHTTTYSFYEKLKHCMDPLLAQQTKEVPVCNLYYYS
jgi:hypothetical protein